MPTFRRREPEGKVPTQERAAQQATGTNRPAAGMPGARPGEQVSPEAAALLLRGRLPGSWSGVLIGLGAGISGQWLIVDSPDVDDGAELSLFGIFRFQFGGGLRVYF